MGSFVSKAHKYRRKSQAPLQQKQQQQHHEPIERQRSFSIHPDDWRDKDYREVMRYLQDKYPKAHVTTQAEKEHGTLQFDRPLSFQEGDVHIVIVYHAVTERIIGFYDAMAPQC